MSHSSSQTFLRERDKKLWTAADTLPVHADGIKESGRLAHPYKITSTGKLIDDALEAVEKENPKLKHVLNKNYTQLQIAQENLAGLIDLIATIPFLLTNQFAKSVSLERAMKANLKGLGYAL